MTISKTNETLVASRHGQPIEVNNNQIEDEIEQQGNVDTIGLASSGVTNLKKFRVIRNWLADMSRSVVVEAPDYKRAAQLANSLELSAWGEQKHGDFLMDSGGTEIQDITHGEPEDRKKVMELFFADPAPPLTPQEFAYQKAWEGLHDLFDGCREVESILRDIECQAHALGIYGDFNEYLGD